jgi:hypothetical protein
LGVDPITDDDISDPLTRDGRWRPSSRRRRPYMGASAGGSKITVARAVGGRKRPLNPLVRVTPVAVGVYGILF